MTRYAAKGGVEHVDSITITPDQLQYYVNAEVVRHMDVVKEASEEDVQDTADYVVAYLKETSPKLTGKYAKGWTNKMHHAADGSPFAVVHNVKKSGLTHLLEHGHGGPHPAKAKPHIEAAYYAGVRHLDERMNKS